LASADPAIRFVVRLVALLRNALEAVVATRFRVRIEFLAIEMVLSGGYDYSAD
jgi:hypothetical protein